MANEQNYRVVVAKNENTVEEKFSCPNCHNDDIDTLQIDDNDNVKCLECGTEYNLNNPDTMTKQNCEICPFRNQTTFTCQLNCHISVYGQKSCVIGYTTNEIQAKLTGQKQDVLKGE